MIPSHKINRPGSTNNTRIILKMAPRPTKTPSWLMIRLVEILPMMEPHTARMEPLVKMEMVQSRTV